VAGTPLKKLMDFVSFILLILIPSALCILAIELICYFLQLFFGQFKYDFVIISPYII